MALSLKHTFQSAKGDPADTTLVRPSNWNAEHTILMATGKVLGRSTASTGPVEELDASVTGRAVLAAADGVAARAAIGEMLTANIADAAVTLVKMANLATAKLIGRSSGSTGVPQAVGLGDGLAMSGSNVQAIGGAPRGYINGFTMTWVNGDNLSFSAGVARSSGNTVSIARDSSMTSKDLTIGWQAGSSGGMKAAGLAMANDTWHIFAICKADGSDTDFLAHTSTNPNADLPSGYTVYRRIGSIIRSGGAIRQFFQDGNQFQFADTVADVAAVNPGTGGVTHTLTVPTGLGCVRADFAGSVVCTAGVSRFGHYFDPAVNAEPGTSGRAHLSSGTSSGTSRASGQFTIRTNTNAQIQSRFDSSSGTMTHYITTRGWYDDFAV